MFTPKTDPSKIAKFLEIVKYIGVLVSIKDLQIK